jgi:hypothetical protein
MEHFELLENYAVFRVPTGYTTTQTVDGITTAIVYASKQQVQRLLVDVRGFSDQQPGLGERYFVLREWADATKGKIRVAMVAGQELMGPREFAHSVATSIRFDIRAFITEEEALLWLLDSK